MKILYQNPGFEHSADSIMLFQTDDQTPYWSDTLSYFYPQVDRQSVLGLCGTTENVVPTSLDAFSLLTSRPFCGIIIPTE